MAEYIDKDKFCHFLFKEIAHVEETQTDTEIPISLVLQSVVNEIKKFPSEDVQPVKHGKWMYCSIEDVFHCTVCDAAAVRNTFVYCPICGAKMDGKE